MVDRLEELLALLEREDEDEGREDGPELRTAAVPAARASEIETENVQENGGREDAPAEKDEALPADGGELNWMPDVRMPAGERRDAVPGADGLVDDGAAGSGAAGNGVTELLWDDLAVPVMGSNGTIALRKPGSGDVEIAALVGASKQADAAAGLGAVMGSLSSAEKGLEGLYRQTVQASRPAAQSLPVKQAGQSLRADEPGRTAALTVDELDRAVRRDSRRYDGGMTLF